MCLVLLEDFIAKIGCYEATVKLANWPMKDVLISGRYVLIKGVTYSNTFFAHLFNLKRHTQFGRCRKTVPNTECAMT